MAMKFLPNPAKWLRRTRTDKGFGVHSPFAFAFITKVLRDYKARYYAFPEIDSLCGKTHRGALLDNLGFNNGDFDRQEARMLFRILCHFNPQQVIEIGGGSEVSRVIIERAIPNADLRRWSRETLAKIDLDKSCFIIVHYSVDINFTIVRSYLLDALDRHPEGVVIYFRNLALPIMRRLFMQFDSVQSYGMTFCDELSAIYVGRRDLPRQRFFVDL